METKSFSNDIIPDITTSAAELSTKQRRNVPKRRMIYGFAFSTDELEWGRK